MICSYILIIRLINNCINEIEISINTYKNIVGRGIKYIMDAI